MKYLKDYGLKYVILFFIFLSFTSCECSNSPASSEADSPKWEETPLTAAQLPPVQINVSTGSRSWVFANMLRASETWIGRQGTMFNYAEAQDVADTIQINENGWPIGLPEGYRMYLSLSGYPKERVWDEESGSYDETYLHGVFVLTWEGTGDVRLGTSENNGIGYETLLSEDHRIVMKISTDRKHPVVNVYASSTYNPVRNMRLWAPAYDGAGLALTAASDLTAGNIEGSLEPGPGEEEPMWHPRFLGHLNEAGSGGVYRFMSWLTINEETWDRDELNWSDRAHAEYQFYNLSVIDETYVRHAVNNYKQRLGLPYEWLIDLCNETGNDLWIQVPHTASDDLIRNLARLIAGSNGHSGLHKDLRVWFEYSNEVWNGIVPYLAQHNKARDLAAVHFGIPPEDVAFNQVGWGSGRLQGHSIAVFEDEWNRLGESDERCVNVVAGFAMSPAYNKSVVDSVREVGNDLPEVLGITSYFGSGTQGEIFALRWSDYTEETWPAAMEGDWPAEFYDKTKVIARRNLYDTFPAWQQNGQLAREENIHLVCYEGGQHMLPLGYGDHANPVHEDFMNYMESFQRSDQIKELFTEHYALWSLAGGRTASLFVDVGRWSFWGYWGAKECIMQTRSTSKKWDSFISWIETMNGVRPVNEPVNTAPELEITPLYAEAQLACAFDITSTGGDGTTAISLIGGELPEGVTFTPGPGGTATVAGTAASSGLYRFVVRALDADGDPAYGLYTLSVDPPGVRDHAILAFRGEEIPATVRSDGTLNGRYDPQRTYVRAGAFDERLYIPFSVDDGSALFGPEYDDGTYSISQTSQLNMYGGWSVIQLDTSVPSVESSYTTLRENSFQSWSGANYEGTGVPTDLDIMLVWRKDQFTGYTSSSQYGFGSAPEVSALRIDLTDIIDDGTNNIRFVVLNREGAVDRWYISEAEFSSNVLGDGYFELTGFTGSSDTGKRWAEFTPTADSFAMPDPAALMFTAHTFSDIRAAGFIYHGHRGGYHYSFGFNRFIVLGEQL